jgi:hypothetical protein
VVLQSGWDFKHYLNNPIVLWAHDYSALPIGVCDEIETREVNGVMVTVAKGRFAPEEANPFAQQVRKLYDAKMIRTTSVGFIAREMDGNKITKAELLEFSFVPVPANPEALSLAKELGLDTVAKKLFADVKTADTDAEVPSETPEITPEEEEKEEPEVKDAVAVVVADRNIREMKWENLEKVGTIIDALFTVYLDDATPLEDFGKLVSETGALISALSGSASEGATVEDAMKTNTHRYTSRKDTDVMERAVRALELATASLKKGETVEQTPAEEPPKENGEPGVKQIVEHFKKYNDERATLRIIATVVGKALQKRASPTK